MEMAFFKYSINGSTAYTRDGALKISADGNIVTVDGNPILGGFQPLLPSSSNMHVAQNGEVTVVSASGGKIILYN